MKRELVDQYKDEMERRMAKTIWVRGKCPRASCDRGVGGAVMYHDTWLSRAFRGRHAV